MAQKPVALTRGFVQIESMSVKDIPNFEQLTDLERLGLAEELAASVRRPGGIARAAGTSLGIGKAVVSLRTQSVSALSQTRFWTAVESLKA